ncbi:hypothetical protein HanLR1_Chr15g0599891 [Helianthus annuus]|nr:hypothetical protein HanHA89_Chr15g0638991 [Helianthus annuus]KAJ0650805.1 hypothetical protein HanLR1_Chr15g0599891 [Helianthus annuus]
MFFVLFEDKGHSLQCSVNIKDDFCNLLYYKFGFSGLLITELVLVVANLALG